MQIAMVMGEEWAAWVEEWGSKLNDRTSKRTASAVFLCCLQTRDGAMCIMEGYMKKRALLFIFAGMLLASPSWAALYDLQLSSEDIVLQPRYPIAKQPVRIYATVQNLGERDTEATIEFFDGERKIGSKFVSVRTGGRPDEVWLEWTPMSEGDHLLRVRLVSDSDTPDEDLTNGSATLEVYADRDTDEDTYPDRVDQDDDNDGTLDVNDQFPLDPRRQKDTDKDGIDDKEDNDIDNDGLTNTQEREVGTDPLRRDTDGDGVGDKDDVYPLDRTRSAREIPKPVVVTPPAPTLVAATKPATTPTVSVKNAIAAVPAPVAPAMAVNVSATSSSDAIQPVTPDVLKVLGIETGTSTAVMGAAEPTVQEEAVTNPSLQEEEESSSAMVPILWGLAIVSAVLGGWFLFKSRSVE